MCKGREYLQTLLVALGAAMLVLSLALVPQNPVSASFPGGNGFGCTTCYQHSDQWCYYLAASCEGRKCGPPDTNCQPLCYCYKNNGYCNCKLQ
jgi:hypothetical protein